MSDWFSNPIIHADHITSPTSKSVSLKSL